MFKFHEVLIPKECKMHSCKNSGINGKAKVPQTITHNSSYFPRRNHS